MAHSHTHSGDRSSFYLDQICTVGACAALATICVLMWWENRLEVILAPQFFKPVLFGGIALMLLVAVRAASLWVEAGRESQSSNDDHQHDENCEHDHDHGHHEHCDHNHDHDHADCGHSHDHAWTPAKYAVLLLPVVLYLVGLPNAGFSADYFRKSLGGELEQSDREVAAKGTMVLGFRELGEACHNATKREVLEGHTVKLKGMYMPLLPSKVFTLFRVKMTCCAADARPMQVRIIPPRHVSQVNEKDWVEVEGLLTFGKVGDKYVPVLTLDAMDQIRPCQPDNSED